MKKQKAEYQKKQILVDVTCKILVCLCFLFMNIQAWSQEKTEKFVIRTYGFYNWNDRERIADSIRETWNIHYHLVAGCVVTDGFVDSIETLNDLTYQKLEDVYGKDWRQRLDQEIDSNYQVLLVKKESTYRTIENCTNNAYYFQTKENLSGTQTKITIFPVHPDKKSKNNLAFKGLQNKDPFVVYRGYANKLELDFSAPDDTLFLSIKCKGSLLLRDSCLTSNKIHFDYHASSIRDTVFIESSNGDSIQFIFKVLNLEPPVLAINNQILDSTFSRKQLKNLNEIGCELQKDALLKTTYTVESWEIIANNKSYSGSGKIIPIEVGKELKKLESGTIINLFTVVRSSDCVSRKKMASFKLI